MAFPSAVPAETIFGASPPTGVRARIIGLGTPFGDDRVGWEVVARLRDLIPVGTRADAASDPLIVLDNKPEDGLLIILDACRGAGPEGSVHRFEWPDPRLTADRGISSHGVQLAAALELAGILGRLPPQVVVFAVEGIAAEPGEGFSHAVEASLPEMVDRVLAELLRSRE